MQGLGMNLTEEIMIKFPAPDGPPTKAAIKLGPIATVRVNKFRTHGTKRKFKKPW
jgi:hypothetical protein